MQPILNHNSHEHLSVQVYQQVGRKSCHCKSKNKVLTTAHVLRSQQELVR